MNSKPAKDLPNKDLPDETPAQEDRRQTPTPQQTDLRPPLPEDLQPTDPEARAIYWQIKASLQELAEQNARQRDPRLSLPEDHPLRWVDIIEPPWNVPMDRESVAARLKASVMEYLDQKQKAIDQKQKAPDQEE